jgi:hypothetical protein
MTPSESACCHEYDCAINPLNFEFVAWLVQADMIRRRHGGRKPDPLRIKFINIGHPNDTKGREQPGAGVLWLEEVMRPMLPMIGAIEDPEAECDPYPYMSIEHIERDIADAARRGEVVPLLYSDHIAFQPVMGHLINAGYDNPITITLRESTFWPHRNSNLEAWMRFANDLGNAGEKVIFLRDYIKADEPLEYQVTYPRASRELRYRMTLYSVAKMNFFTSNGPAMMTMFSPYPYLVFMTHYAGHQFPQRPWANALQRELGKPDIQRMVYRKDTYEKISEAWEDMRAGVSQHII